MTDHPIPDELVNHIARLGIPASERRPDALDRQRAWNMLQSLAEWADGGLIDPSTWTVVEAKPAERWHNLYDLDGKVICNHPERDYCSHPDEGDWSNWTYTLSPREGER